jgi:hypothetical protein
MAQEWELPDPITFLEGLLPGNPFQGEPPLPRGLLAMMEGTPQEEKFPDQVEKPGCTAAERTILTLGFLEGLAEGEGGFGVLRQGKDYLERAAHAAESLGRRQLARDLRDIAGELPQVRTPEQARAVAERLRPLKSQAWLLGKQCDHLYLVGTQAIIALAERVAEGEISLQEAKELMNNAS